MTNKEEFRRVLVVDVADNVGTVIDDRTGLLAHSGGPVEAGVPYGHKIALQDIESGGRIVKFGVTIGTATKPISAGAHVHVHNVSEPDE